jgi:hypothetical protein
MLSITRLDRHALDTEAGIRVNHLATLGDLEHAVTEGHDLLRRASREVRASEQLAPEGLDVVRRERVAHHAAADDLAHRRVLAKARQQVVPATLR